MSHLLIVSVLTLGYGLSQVYNMPETEYATLDVSVPPSFYSGTPPTLKPSRILRDVEGLFKMPMQAPSLEQFFTISDQVRVGQ